MPPSALRSFSNMLEPISVGYATFWRCSVCATASALGLRDRAVSYFSPCLLPEVSFALYTPAHHPRCRLRVFQLSMRPLKSRTGLLFGKSSETAARPKLPR